MKEGDFLKKSKKYKKWKRDNDFIKKQKSKALPNRIMGNCKIECYSCVWAGYLFDEEKCQYTPYCCNHLHLGKIVNYSISKWNDNNEIREEKYMSYNKTINRF